MMSMMGFLFSDPDIMTAMMSGEKELSPAVNTKLINFMLKDPDFPEMIRLTMKADPKNAWMDKLNEAQQKKFIQIVINSMDPTTLMDKSSSSKSMGDASSRKMIQ